MMEPYLHALGESGVCSGIVSELYIPPIYSNSSLSLTSSWALNTTSNALVLQGKIEDELTLIFSLVPSWTSEACYTSLRRYFCTARMVKAERKTLEEPLKAALGDQFKNASTADIAQIKERWGSMVNISTAKTITDLLHTNIYIPSFPSRHIYVMIICLSAAIF
jgi:hypothetical protein